MSGRPHGLILVTSTRTYVVQFIVEATSVAHGVPVGVTPPERGGGGLTVSAAGARSPGGRLWVTQEVIKSQNTTKTVPHQLYQTCLKSCPGDVSNVFMNVSWAERSIFVFAVDQSTQPWTGTRLSKNLP